MSGSTIHTTVTSSWARLRLKWPASPLFTQPIIQAHIKEKHQSSASQAFVRGIHQGAVDSPHKWPVTRTVFPFDDISGYRINCWGGRPKIRSVFYQIQVYHENLSYPYILHLNINYLRFSSTSPRWSRAWSHELHVYSIHNDHIIHANPARSIADC